MHCGFIDCRDDDLFGACPSFESHPTRSRWGGNRWSFAGPWRAADSPAKYTLDNVANALWHDQSEFPEQAANLVGLRRSSLHEALPHPVKTEHGLLFNVLDVAFILHLSQPDVDAHAESPCHQWHASTLWAVRASAPGFRDANESI